MQNKHVEYHQQPKGSSDLAVRKTTLSKAKGFRRFSFPALSIDDSDSSYSVSQLLPQHHGLTGSSSTKAAAAAVGTRSILTLPSPASRSRLYSDLTIPESLLASAKDNLAPRKDAAATATATPTTTTLFSTTTTVHVRGAQRAYDSGRARHDGPTEYDGGEHQQQQQQLSPAIRTISTTTATAICIATAAATAILQRQ